MKFLVKESQSGTFFSSDKKKRYAIVKGGGKIIPDGWTEYEGDTREDVASSLGFTSLFVKPQANPIAEGAAHVIKAGFDADKKIILLNKLLKVKDAGAEAANPKLVALYTWMETVQAMAIAGQTAFPPAPFTFEEVIAE